jgi:hypothetical protein
MVADHQRQHRCDRSHCRPDILAQLAGAGPIATMAASFSLASAMVGAEIVLAAGSPRFASMHRRQ